MCGRKAGCQKPEELKGRPEECSEEQIRKCHGEDKSHPCVGQKQSETKGKGQGCCG